MSTKYFGGMDLAQIGTLTAAAIISLGLLTTATLNVTSNALIQNNLAVYGTSTVAATYISGSSTVPVTGIYGGLNYGTSLNIKQYYATSGPSIGEQIALQMVNSSGTSGLGFFTFGGDCGVTQFYSVSSGAPLLTYIPNDVNLNSQDCIDQGLSTLSHGIFLGNGQTGYKEPVLPFTNGETNLGSETWKWGTVNAQNYRGSTLVVDGNDTASTRLGVFSTVLMQENVSTGSIALLLTTSTASGGMMVNVDDCGGIDFLQGNNAYGYLQFIPTGVPTSTLSALCGRTIPTDDYYGIQFGNNAGGINNFYPVNPNASSLGFLGNPWNSLVASSTIATTSTSDQFVKNTGGSANAAVCYKSDGKTLGRCSTAISATGTCTCL